MPMAVMREGSDAGGVAWPILGTKRGQPEPEIARFR
jgi:hypothetical protein